jgi:outer membrane receptor for ferrienterochelin and colicins
MSMPTLFSNTVRLSTLALSILGVVAVQSTVFAQTSDGSVEPSASAPATPEAATPSNADAGVVDDAGSPASATPAAAPAESSEPADEWTDPTNDQWGGALSVGLSSADESQFASMDLEALLEVRVVTATKTETKLSDAPAIISVVSRDDIARWGYQNMAEALQHIVGFYVIDDHVTPNVGVRGIAGGMFGESQTVKFMIDGHSVAFRSTGGNWLGPELIPLSAVDHVEIIRGPCSALYGADAFLGVVNIITRKGSDLSGADARVSGEKGSGSDLGYDVDATGGAHVGAMDAMVSARVHSEDRSGMAMPSTSPAPQVPAYRGTDLVSHGATQTADVVFAKASYQLRPTQTLTAFAHYAQFSHGSEFSPWTQMPYGLDSAQLLHQTRIALHQMSTGAAYEGSFSHGGNLTVRGFYFSGGPSSGDTIDVGSDIFYIKRQFGYQGFEGQVEGRIDLAEKLGIVAGTEVIADREKLPVSQEILESATGNYNAGDVVLERGNDLNHKLITNIGAYVQASWSRLAPLFSMVAGGRYDQHSIYGGQLSARVGMVSSPAKRVHIKVLYGSAFLAPSPLLMYGVPNKVGDVLGNPSLAPQRVHTVEGQVSVNPWRGVVVSSGLAYSLLLNKAAFVQQGLNRVAENLSEMRALSWESELVADWENMVRAYASFELPIVARSLGQPGYQAELVGHSNVIYPSFMVRGGVSARVPGPVPLKLGVEAMYVGSRRASDMNILEAGSSYSLPAYTMLDATVSTTPLELLGKRKTVVMFKMHNLLDVKGPDPGFAGVDYPLLARSFFLQLRQEF